MLIELIFKAGPVLAALPFTETWGQIILVTLFWVVIRRYIVSMIMGIRMMDNMDYSTLNSPPTAPANVISVSFM